MREAGAAADTLVVDDLPAPSQMTWNPNVDESAPVIGRSICPTRAFVGSGSSRDRTGADKASGLTAHVGVDIQVVHLEIGRLLAGDELAHTVLELGQCAGTSTFSDAKSVKDLRTSLWGLLRAPIGRGVTLCPI